MNTTKLRLGLIGKDVSKSTSGKAHTFILAKKGVACEFEYFSVAPENFDNAMRRLMGDFDGFNVTIPYKREVLAYLSDVQGDALDCGAVNTVVTATAQGYNTDTQGFLLMLAVAGVKVQGKSVLILGAGGAGRSSAVALKNAGARVSMYRRNRTELEETCRELGVTAASDPESGGYDIVINCTGVGMHDTEGVSPVPTSAFKGARWAIDLIYTPEESEFLKLAKVQGAKTLNGKSMLFYQAYYADCLYLGCQPNPAEAKKLYEEYISIQ